MIRTSGYTKGGKIAIPFPANRIFWVACVFESISWLQRECRFFDACSLCDCVLRVRLVWTTDKYLCVFFSFYRVVETTNQIYTVGHTAAYSTVSTFTSMIFHIPPIVMVCDGILVQLAASRILAPEERILLIHLGSYIYSWYILHTSSLMDMMFPDPFSPTYLHI